MVKGKSRNNRKKDEGMQYREQRSKDNLIKF